MADPIDSRINDYIKEYLESKGYSNTSNAFVRERQDRKEPVDKSKSEALNEKEKEREKYENIKVVCHSKLNFYVFASFH